MAWKILKQSLFVNFLKIPQVKADCSWDLIQTPIIKIGMVGCKNPISWRQGVLED